jgi:hypothetical protein
MISMRSLESRLRRCSSAAGALVRPRGGWSRSSAKLYVPAITRLLLTHPAGIADAIQPHVGAVNLLRLSAA